MYILYNSIYMEFSGRQNCNNEEVISKCQGFEDNVITDNKEMFFWTERII